jgi:hypothetical protein
MSSSSPTSEDRGFPLLAAIWKGQRTVSRRNTFLVVVYRGSVIFARKGMLFHQQILGEYPTGRRNELDTRAVTLIDRCKTLQDGGSSSSNSESRSWPLTESSDFVCISFRLS